MILEKINMNVGDLVKISNKNLYGIVTKVERIGVQFGGKNIEVCTQHKGLVWVEERDLHTISRLPQNNKLASFF